MKQLLLILTVFLAGSLSAQTLEVSNTQIKFPTNGTAMDGVNPTVKTTACGPDTNGYALAKASGLQALNLNSATSATAVAQYFNAPQAITISGVSFYAWKADATGGIAGTMNVEVYAAAPDSTPLGTPLASATVTVDTAFTPGTLDFLQKNVTFTTPVTVSSAYVIVVGNNSPNSMSMVFSDWTAGDGDQEWLASAQIGANWLRGYDLNVGGSTFDADGLVEPHTTYNLSANYTVPACVQAGAVTTFPNGSSPIVGDRMYNVAAFLAAPELSYTWDYGDGSLLDNVVDGSNTYATAGTYTVALNDTIFGWTTNCADDTVATITAVGAVTANYTSSTAGLVATFTNTSTAGGSATYLWDFGDGNTSTQTDPIHTYAADGTYTVCLITTEGCAADTTCQTVTVGCPVPTPGFSFTTAGSTATFTNSSTAGTGAVYLWDLGDGNTSTQQNPTHTFAADGNYTVCLIVNDICGTDSTCQTVVITTCSDPIALFSFAENPPGSGNIDFTQSSIATGNSTYSWDFGDGSTSTDENPSHTYSSNGSYDVTFIIVDSCGTDTLTGTVILTSLNVDELALSDISVFPNPSNGIFNISTSLEMTEAYITDLSGKVVYTGELSGNEGAINAEQFANGAYFLSIRFTNDLIQTIRLEVIK
jgi:PKD repeat protein